MNDSLIHVISHISMIHDSYAWYDTCHTYMRDMTRVLRSHSMMNRSYMWYDMRHVAQHLRNLNLAGNPCATAAPFGYYNGQGVNHTYNALNHTCNTLQHTCNSFQPTCNTLQPTCNSLQHHTCYHRPIVYEVATISRLLKIIGLFCKRAL